MRASIVLLVAAACGGHHVTSGSCPTGQAECTGTCIDVQSDPANCGACMAACTVTDPLCQAGTCVASCSSGYTQCGGACVDTTSDPYNCGSCGTLCAINLSCVNSQCVAGPCRGTECGGVCVDTTSDPANCGGCGNACPVTMPYCVASACTWTCPSGTSPCGGQCVNLQTNAQDCGSCGTVCASGVCTNGMCQSSTCGSGSMVCNGTCVDTTENVLHCGSCTTMCNDTQFCFASACDCRPGLVTIVGNGAICVDPNSDPQACGPSKNRCVAPNLDCQQGSCVSQCTSPYTNCTDACVDLQTDPLHCGTCNTRCAADEVCVAGTCEAYTSLPGCTTCPCAGCSNHCCSYPDDPSYLICVNASACP